SVSAPTEIYPLSLHDALPILQPAGRGNRVEGEHHHVGITAGLQRLVEVRDLADAALPAAVVGGQCGALQPALHDRQPARAGPGRSEEHTSELQSRENLVCRLL